MNRYGKRCVLYPRVSTEMQVDGYSLEGQKNMLTRFADREEMIIVDTYEDAGKSGKSIEGRPAFQKMLRDIEDGLDIDYILVYKLSRFGRNAADILNSLELVQSYGVNLICIEEGIDSSQTSGKLLISVLSAVAEIERENIIEQTMNGRREKARQGGWNGGFAPYGYTLEDNKLMIEETEAVAIRKIFELYTSSEIGLGGIANQLNLQGIRKIPRQNGTLEDWTGHFIKLILDNPVYCGKIAYGRRTKEKVKGTKNDYQMKRNDDYILTEGQHKGIVSEEVWEKAHAKRLRTGVKQPSKIGRDRVHLLSGLLKCPVCGSPMYTNKHAWTNKDGTYKEIYYYVCSRNRMVRGKHCEYKAMLKKTDIEPMVIEAIREIVRNEEYAQAIKKRIGVQIDTKAVDKELEGYQAKLKEVDLNKTRLEREIDSLPADAKYRERKLHDMTLRLDSLYDVIVELEEKIEDARLRRDAIKQQAITLENIYKIMVNFDCVYNIINDEEKRNVVTALIKEIEIYRNDESEYPLKRIGLNFPVFKDGGEVTELLWDKGNTVERLALVVASSIGADLAAAFLAATRLPVEHVFFDGGQFAQIGRGTRRVMTPFLYLAIKSLYWSKGKTLKKIMWCDDDAIKPYFIAAGKALTYGNLRRQLADSLENKPFPVLSEVLQAHCFFEFGGIEDHFKYRDAVMRAYPQGHFPVFEQMNHMQFQIQNPQGFGAMLENIIETGGLPDLPFLRQASERKKP